MHVQLAHLCFRFAFLGGISVSTGSAVCGLYWWVYALADVVLCRLCSRRSHGRSSSLTPLFDASPVITKLDRYFFTVPTLHVHAVRSRRFSLFVLRPLDESPSSSSGLADRLYFWDSFLASDRQHTRYRHSTIVLSSPLSHTHQRNTLSIFSACNVSELRILSPSHITPHIHQLFSFSLPFSHSILIIVSLSPFCFSRSRSRSRFPRLRPLVLELRRQQVLEKIYSSGDGDPVQIGFVLFIVLTFLSSSPPPPHIPLVVSVVLYFPILVHVFDGLSRFL